MIEYIQDKHKYFHSVLNIFDEGMQRFYVHLNNVDELKKQIFVSEQVMADIRAMKPDTTEDTVRGALAQSAIEEFSSSYKKYLEKSLKISRDAAYDIPAMAKDSIGPEGTQHEQKMFKAMVYEHFNNIDAFIEELQVDEKTRPFSRSVITLRNELAVANNQQFRLAIPLLENERQGVML